MPPKQPDDERTSGGPAPGSLRDPADGTPGSRGDRASAPAGESGESPGGSPDAAPVAVSGDDSGPVRSTQITTAATPVAPVSPGESDTRTRRITDAAKDALDAGVTRLGTGIETLGSGVSKLGELSRHVPVVGSGVSRLGEGITNVGESLHGLPQVARTRRGRLLIRSAVVGFVLVAAWIVVIVGLQLHGNDTPDFRPTAETILVGLSEGSIDEVYEQASPRFQEMVRKERFIDDMTDLAGTVGKFREITAVNDSIATTGPTGQIGRVSLTVAYEKATCKVAVSLHNNNGRWRLLGVGVELPPELEISQAQREERVKACKDPMDIKQCDVHQAADAILRRLKSGQIEEVWDEATSVFQKQEHKARFVELQQEHIAALGDYRRIIAVSEAKVINGTLATFDSLAEFEKASGARIVFGFYRRSESAPWKLRSFKVVLPMPRPAGDATRPADAPPDGPAPPVAPAPPAASRRDAGTP